MKKTTTKKTTTSVKKAPVKARASASRKTVKPVSKARAKKPAAKKGVLHHTKRLYHATPKFIHGAIVGGLTGVLVVAMLSVTSLFPTTTDAASKCDAKGIGDKYMTLPIGQNSAYTGSGNQVTITFNVTGKNCALPITMVVWNAPSVSGLPFDQQTLFFHTSAVFSEGRHTLTGTLPNCYYQVDTVTGTKLTGATGGAHDYGGRQLGTTHGGTQSCNQPPTTPPVQVCDTTTHQIISVKPEEVNNPGYSKDTANCTPPPTTTTTTSLPNTGPGATLIIGALAVIGGIVFHKLHHRNKGRKLHAK